MSKEKISRQEKRRIIVLFSARPVSILSGIFAGITAALIFSFIVISLLVLGNVKIELAGRYVIQFILSFMLVGIIASEVWRIEYRLTKPLVYFLFLTAIFIGAIFKILVPWVTGVQSVFLLSFALSTAEVVSWILIILGIIFAAAILADLLNRCWKYWHIFWLEKFSPVDYILIKEREDFHERIDLAFAEVKSYPAPFTLGAMVMENYEELTREIVPKVMRKIEMEVMDIIITDLRSTDMAARFDHKIFVGFPHTPANSAMVVLERIKKILEEHEFTVNKKKARIKVKFVCVSYSPEMKTKEDMIEEARKALLSLEVKRG